VNNILSSVSPGDLLAENCVFFLPLSHSAHPLTMFSLEFRGEVDYEETGVMARSFSEDCTIVACVLLTPRQRETLRKTDRRTDVL